MDSLRLKLDNCGRLCVSTRGCTAFHSASPKENSKNEFECFLFGHKSVIPAAGLIGDCFTVSKGAVGSHKMVKTKSAQKLKKEKKKVYKIPEFEEPKVVEEEYDEEDEDWLFEPPPPEIRSREHIAEILGLSEKSKDSVLKVTETTLKELKKVYETSIKGLEKEYKYKELSNRHFGDPEMFNKPLIVLLGPWSGGKSTMINYLLGTEYTKNAFRSSEFFFTVNVLFTEYFQLLSHLLVSILTLPCMVTMRKRLMEHNCLLSGLSPVCRSLDRSFSRN